MAVEKRRATAKAKSKRKDKARNDVEPSKEEYAVAKFVRFNCPTKKANIMGDELPYFAACKAIDCLMSSKFAGDRDKKLFAHRHGCVAYMQNLLDKGMFFRAKKLVPKIKDVKQLVAESKEPQEAAGEKKKQKSAPEEKAQETSVAKAEKEPESSGKKKTKKVKFDVHQNQVFNDGNDIYVWRYDPTSTKIFFLGLAMVIGAIGVCLFPLWPHEVREGVYYLSVAAMVFAGVIILLVVLRTVLFSGVWLCSLGKHHFWLLPHLTDDCGFFDSFKPLYTHTVASAKDQKTDEKQKGEEEIGSLKNSEEENDDKDDDVQRVTELSDEEQQSSVDEEEKGSMLKKTD